MAPARLVYYASSTRGKTAMDRPIDDTDAHDFRRPPTDAAEVARAADRARRRRGGAALKLLATVAVVGGGLAVALWSTAGSAFEYYKHVDEVAGALPAWQKKPL